MVRQLIGEDLRLVLKLDPGVGHIYADGGQIDQILVNLVVNARDAMPNGGSVTISSANAAVDGATAERAEVIPGSYVCLTVSDTGIGMDHATLEHMFEPFFTTKPVGHGTGLGLATTYGIVQQAGGHISVDSEPGVGSVFRLYFPRVDGARRRATAMPSAGPVAGAGRVLVAEDDPAVREITTLFLERAGYDVLAVSDGVEAIAAARISPPFDLLVTDIVMPNMSGTDLAEQMMDEFPQLGVVLLSGYSAETVEIRRATERGATFLSKPVTSSQLLHAVLHAIPSRRAAAARQVDS